MSLLRYSLHICMHVDAPFLLYSVLKLRVEGELISFARQLRWCTDGWSSNSWVERNADLSTLRKLRFAIISLASIEQQTANHSATNRRPLTSAVHRRAPHRAIHVCYQIASRPVDRYSSGLRWSRRFQFSCRSSAQRHRNILTEQFSVAGRQCNNEMQPRSFAEH